MVKLLLSIFRRITTVITSPFRIILLRMQRMFNVNILTSKLVAPLTKRVKSLITLKPQSKDDYYIIGKHWIYKKLILTLILVVCAGVFIYFSMFAPKLSARPTQAEAVKTDVTYAYNDMKVREYTGTANIKAADGQIIYTGEINAGVCEGSGILMDRQGRLLYEGEFKQNKYSGMGVLYYPSGNKKYEGGFADNVYQGEGTLYADDGMVLYIGMFQNGKYEGKGKSYSAQDVLQYQGEFSEGLYHGNGTSYYNDGITRYEGEFFKGKEQGIGTLYNQEGKKLYTGSMQAGTINYRALVNANLQEIEDAFEETPRIFYSDMDSVFVFERAGVIVTVDCRVKVDTWENQSQDKNGTYYYIPSEGPVNDSYSDQSQGSNPFPVIAKKVEPVTPVSQMQQVLDQTVRVLSAVASGIFQPQKMGWYVEDSNTPSTPSIWDPPSSSSDTSSSDTSSSNPFSSDTSSSDPFSSDTSSNDSFSSDPSLSDPYSNSSDFDSNTMPPDFSSGSSEMNPQEESSSPSPSGTVLPNFIEKDITLYFEIDRNIWRSEADLVKNNEKSKLQVSKITVFNQDQLTLPEDVKEYDENVAAGIEDCVAIDYLRQGIPTAFSNVLFEMDKQNKLFVRVGAVNYADKIICKTRNQGNFTYRAYYQMDDAKQLMYFSIEN